MRLPSSAHTRQPWRIHDLTRDFRLEDVWQLPVELGPGDFPRLVETIASYDPAGSSLAVRALFSVRLALGRLLGWDRDASGVGARVPTLRDRLSADLRDGARGPDLGSGFRSIYLTDDEWAAEVANQTAHGVVHVGRVSDGDGRHRAQLAILVKPNGLLGEVYMAAIKPFRHLVVYPQMLREAERAWAHR